MAKTAKKPPKRQKASPKIVNAAANRREAVKLRIQRATYEAIGKKLGVSKAMAYKYVMEALNENAKLAQGEAAHLVAMESERLDILAREAFAVMAHEREAQNTQGVIRAIEAQLKIHERWCRLRGIDAPVKAEITGKDGGPIVGGVLLVPAPISPDEWDAAARKQQATLMEKQGEVIDAE
jgi:hypothetical protein